MVSFGARSWILLGMKIDITNPAEKMSIQLFLMQEARKKRKSGMVGAFPVSFCI
jgi:hypothetical protein